MRSTAIVRAVGSCFMWLLTLSAIGMADPLGTTFSYQGQLKQDGVPLEGKADLMFSLWDAGVAGNTVGAPVLLDAVLVANGLFTVELDFGADAFNGESRFLAVALRAPAWDGQGVEPVFVMLSPRQPISPAPYALQTRGVFVDDTDRVGVGTTSPSVETKLHINADPDNFGVLVDSLGAPGSEIGLHSGPSGYASVVKNAFFAPGWKRFDDTKGAFLQEVFPGGETHFNVTTPGTDYINWSNPLTLTADGATVVNGFLGVGRSSKVHPTEYFGVQAPIDSGFGGMYVQTNGAGAAPFYGYSSGGTLAYHYLDGADENKWKLNLNGVHLTLTQTGRLGVGTTDPQDRLHVVGDALIQGMIQADGNVLAGGFLRSGLGLTVDGAAHQVSSDGDLELHAGSGRALRLENNATSPNLIGGYAGNTVPIGVAGATIAGGGTSGLANFVSGNYGSVGGGASNTADGEWSTVPGGLGNEALGAYSFAAGRGALANHDGSFVWKDSTDGTVASTDANQFIISASGGVGIGTNAPTNALSVFGTANFISSVGIGDATPDARLDVQRSFSALFPVGAVAVFNRTGVDGHIVDFQQNDTVEGWVSVSGTTVTYNAFTGSHLGWTEEKIDRGALVRLTGTNRRLHAAEDSEPIYGITLSTRANDSRCLGAYLSPEPTADANGLGNNHLVMAVGNGDMWVVHTGRDIEPGDLLISSDMPGCAMVDDPERFKTGYVVARAAETVRWSDIDVDAGGRPKRTRIAVLFQSFVRTSASARTAEQLETLRSEAERQRLEIAALTARVESLTRMVTRHADSDCVPAGLEPAASASR